MITRRAEQVVQCLTENPGTNIWCLTDTHANSIKFQQALIFKYLTLEQKRMGRNYYEPLKYSIEHGFTPSLFILPNNSKCLFRNWKQEVTVIEGTDLGCPEPPVDGTHNIGYWTDDLVPIWWLDALRSRCMIRSHKKPDGVRRFPASGLISSLAMDIR